MAPVDRKSPASRAEWLWALALLALLAFALRGWTFGNPVLHVDDEFYLLGGQRLLAGQLPYVDFWDRKPAGLFLLYALPNLLPDPVIAYQVLATLSAVATGALIFAMARPLAGWAPAVAGGAAYLAWLPLFGGIGGQTPVFYNLPMAWAALLTLDRVARTGQAGLTRRGAAIMLLVGCAMQIKYSVVFEGVFLGVTLMWCGHRQGRGAARIAGDATLWIACALGPTLAVWGFYAAKGQGMLFVHANFLSVFADEKPFDWALVRLGVETFGLVPFWICCWAAFRHWRRSDSSGRGEALWLLAWAASALFGFLVFGTWFDHYVLPLLVPLCVEAALAIGLTSRLRLAIGLLVGLGLSAGLGRAISDRGDWGNAAQAAQLTALVERHRGTGCLFVTEDVPILYFRTRSCIPTRYAFPEHLVLSRYANALGVSQTAELQRVFASKPSVVVFLDDPDADYLPGARALLTGELGRNYRLAGTAQVGTGSFRVYARSSF